MSGAKRRARIHANDDPDRRAGAPQRPGFPQRGVAADDVSPPCRGRLRALYVHGRPRKENTTGRTHGQWRTIGTWCLGCGEIKLDPDAEAKV